MARSKTRRTMVDEEADQPSKVIARATGKVRLSTWVPARTLGTMRELAEERGESLGDVIALSVTVLERLQREVESGSAVVLDNPHGNSRELLIPGCYPPPRPAVAGAGDREPARR